MKFLGFFSNMDNSGWSSWLGKIQVAIKDLYIMRSRLNLNLRELYQSLNNLTVILLIWILGSMTQKERYESKRGK